MNTEIAAAIQNALNQTSTPPDIQTFAVVVRELDRPWLNLTAVASLLRPDGKSRSKNLDVVFMAAEADEIIDQLERAAHTLRELVALQRGTVS